MQKMNLMGASKDVELFTPELRESMCTMLERVLGAGKVTADYTTSPEGCSYTYYLDKRAIFKIDFRKMARWEAHVDATTIARECPAVFDTTMAIVARACLDGYYADMCIIAEADIAKKWYRLVGAYADNGIYRVQADRLRVVLISQGMLDT